MVASSAGARRSIAACALARASSLLAGLVAGLGGEGAEPCRLQGRARIDVGDDDFPAGIPLAPVGDEALGEAARLAALGKDAGADLQERFHVWSPFGVEFRGPSVALMNSIKKRNISLRSIYSSDMSTPKITLDQWSALAAVVEAG